MIKKTLGGRCQVLETDKHNRHMWVRLDPEQAQPIFIVGCYIPHRGSNFYDRVTQVRREDPMEDIEQEVVELTREGEVILIGDFNAIETLTQT